MLKNLPFILIIFMLSPFTYGCKRYVTERGYGDVTIIIESTKQYHSWGEPIPLKVSVKNKGKKPFIFNTKGKPLRGYPETSFGLSEPRPVYDLVVVKGVWDKPEGYWVWSQDTKETPTEIVLQPQETRVIIETVWVPEKPFHHVGIFVRFADAEFATGITVEQPKR